MKTPGIVLELNDRQAIVMTREAGFRVIKPQPGMFIGQQVETDKRSLKEKSFRFANRPYSMTLASIAFFIFIGLAVIHFSAQSKVYAFVTVDINPSVEFSINKNIRIISVKGLNRDGIMLLQGIGFKNMPVNKALLMLVDKAEKHQYFHNPDGKYVLIAAAAESKSIKGLKLLTNSIRMVETKLNKRNIHLQFIQATIAQRKIALQSNISTGRYLLLDTATQYGQTMDLNQAKTEPIAILIKKIYGIEKSKVNAVINHSNLHPKDMIPEVKRSADITKSIEADSIISGIETDSVAKDTNSNSNVENSIENSDVKTMPDSKMNTGYNAEDSEDNDSTDNQTVSENDTGVSDSKTKDNQLSHGNSSNSGSNSNHSNSGSSGSKSNSSSSNGSNSHSGGSSSGSHNNSSKK